MQLKYRDFDGEPLFQRERLPEGATPRFRQPKGCRLEPYGRERLGPARRSGRLFLCAVESDTWASWTTGLPALGIPGAHGLASLTGEDLSGIGCVIVCVDGYQAGDDLLANIGRRLAELKFSGPRPASAPRPARRTWASSISAIREAFAMPWRTSRPKHAPHSAQIKE